MMEPRGQQGQKAEREPMAEWELKVEQAQRAGQELKAGQRELKAELVQMVEQVQRES